MHEYTAMGVKSASVLALQKMKWDFLLSLNMNSHIHRHKTIFKSRREQFFFLVMVIFIYISPGYYYQNCVNHVAK